VSIFGKLTGALIGTLFGPFGILMGIILGHLVDLAVERNAGATGSEARELITRIFSLWGRIAAPSNGLTQFQGLFLQTVLTNRLNLRGLEAQQAMKVFEDAFQGSQGKPWSFVLAETTQIAQEIYEDFFLDRQTLIWIYATGRQLASLGVPKPGLTELLDAVAKAFFIWEEVGSSGSGPSDQGGQHYEKTWENFRPASSAGPEAYAVLGLKPEASVDEIKKAYRALVRQYHPDAHTNLPDTDPLKKKAAERFLQVQQAYERIRQSRKF
jgi:DnaJ like chaperone protein